MRRVAFLLLFLFATVSGAQAADTKSRTFVVYFQEWSVGIDEDAQKVIAEAADMAKANPQSAVRVTGFADPTGSRAANIMLSELRALRVSDYLQENGIAKLRIMLRGKGPVQFAVSSIESRRVEITVKPR